jgi:hydrogenase maturation protease
MHEVAECCAVCDFNLNGRVLGRAEVPGILIIGYGNTLRGDDGVGIHAARELERQYHDDPEIEIIACQQLTPELADDISRSELVIFLDAAVTDEPGTVETRPILPSNAPIGFMHHLDPASLVSAAEQLYGEVPNAVSVTLTGWSFDTGSRLSREAKLRLPELVRQAREVVTAHRRQLPLAVAYRIQ